MNKSDKLEMLHVIVDVQCEIIDLERSDGDYHSVIENKRYVVWGAVRAFAAVCYRDLGPMRVEHCIATMCETPFLVDRYLLVEHVLHGLNMLRAEVARHYGDRELERLLDEEQRISDGLLHECPRSVVLDLM